MITYPYSSTPTLINGLTSVYLSGGEHEVCIQKYNMYTKYYNCIQKITSQIHEKVTCIKTHVFRISLYVKINAIFGYTLMGVIGI